MSNDTEQTTTSSELPGWGCGEGLWGHEQEHEGKTFGWGGVELLEAEERPEAKGDGE